MGIYAYVIGESNVNIWGLTSRERLARQIAELDDVSLVEDVESLPGDGSVLCVRADYLFESRTLKSLVERVDTLLRCTTDTRVAAGCCAPGKAPAMIASLQQKVQDDGDQQAVDESFSVVEPADLATYEGRLRKAEEPLLLPISADAAAALEDRLYGRSYKGVTDLVTKWFWPRPAKHVVRICARLRLTPNMVTVTGMLLVVYAGIAFYQGDYWLGLAAGWLMTFLDTVDGKLARVTIKSSRIGHVLDHGMDIVHPPFWYVLWGMSLSGPILGFSLEELYWWTFGGYLGGRLIEGAFHQLGDCGLFDWRPFDAYFRLITGRRNPCMIILTVGLALGSPEGAFIGVIVWTVLTSAVLFVRLLQATLARITGGGPLKSWLADPGAAATNHPRAFRSFSRTSGAYGSARDEPGMDLRSESLS